VTAAVLPNLETANSNALRVPARPSQLSVVREFAEEAAAAFGLGADGRYDFAVAVNEAVTNAIRHGAPDADEQIRVSVHANADALTCVVRDFGTFTAPVAPATATSEHGRGFTLMSTLMDAVQLCVSPGNTTVRLTKSRGPSAHPR
jgi:anti-sigma regulatory factor (Ser/Thr protein kinase)